MINVTRSSMPPFEEYISEIKDLWQTRWLTNNGKKHNILEEQLKKYLKIENITLYTNGHLALEAGLNVFDLKGEVITTPFTYASTTQAIVRNGLTPVFCDINFDDYTIDTKKIEELITERTVAILPVHVYGNICNYKEIDKIAEKYNLKVIYDAAHAFGVEVDGLSVGNLGDMSMFSFHATKVFHTIEGGCLIYKNCKLRDKLNALKMYGMLEKENAEFIGLNAKMTEFQAAMGICNLRHIDEEIEKRRIVVDRYRNLLNDVRGIKLLPIRKNVKSNFAYFPVYIDKHIFRKSRDEIIEALKIGNIYARKYFYPTTSNFSVYKNLFEIQSTPIAEKVSKNILTLPLYADLSTEDVDRICKIILRQ